MSTFRVDYTISEKRDRKLNNFKDITDYAGLSKSVLNYMDVLKILKIFGEIRDIKKRLLFLFENVYERTEINRG